MWWFAARFFGSEKCASFAEGFCGKRIFLAIFSDYLLGDLG
jgi:hypothetical protein